MSDDLELVSVWNGSLRDPVRPPPPAAAVDRRRVTVAAPRGSCRGETIALLKARRGGLTAMSIAEQIGMTRANAYRLLSMLVREGQVEIMAPKSSTRDGLEAAYAAQAHSCSRCAERDRAEPNASKITTRPLGRRQYGKDRRINGGAVSTSRSAIVRRVTGTAVRRA